MEDRRQHKRLVKPYRIEYGPFTSIVQQETLKSGLLKNVSGGGVLFIAAERFDIGTQLFLKIYISGWSDHDGECIKVSNTDSELLLMTVAEVLRSDEEQDGYVIGAKFIGRIHS